METLQEREQPLQILTRRSPFRYRYDDRDVTLPYRF
jgi:hypothetical protein